MMILMGLQTAVGHFKEDKAMESVFGKTLEELKSKAPEATEMKNWMTALVIAFIEERCGEEKDLWEMSIDKARAALPDPSLVDKAKDILKGI